MGRFTRNRMGAWTIGLAALVGVWLVWAIAQAGTKERYPYDPACPWGRVADGHGMLIRCLSPQEASVVLNTAAGSREPAGGEARSAPVQQKIAVDALGPVTADTGELPLAVQKLSRAKDRFIGCVKEHGGLTESKAKVVVRFLVRERGRAEGVSVKSRTGMSSEAANCIAQVVDRRYVGYPAAPIVGASLPVEMSLVH